MKNRTVHILQMLLVFCLFVIAKANGQIMEWLIQPSYKDIVYMGKNLYKVKGTNGKWGVYNTSKGELTVPIEYENIGPLVEDRSLILDAQGVRLYGIIDEEGTPVSQLVSASQRPDFAVMKEYPYYSDGLLVVGQPSGQFYNFGYVDKQGNRRTPFNYLYACPFNNGQAMVYTKKEAYQIIDHQGNFPYVGNERINFMSNPDNGIFVLVTGGNRISKAKLENSKFERLKDLEKGQVVKVADATINKSIYSKGPEGKTYMFDNAFHLIEGNAPTVVSPVKTISESNGSLKKKKTGWLYGINYNNSSVLIEQFKEVKVYEDEYAVVTMENNMVGLMRFNPSGKISIEASSTTIEFSHNQESVVPVNVTCQNMMSQPMIELSIIGDNQNQVYKRQGSGKIEIPFYESHNQIGKSTNKKLEVEITADKLKLGRKEINISSSHQAGFRISIGGFPTYSDKRGSASVNVSISSVGGAPSESAVAIVNGAKHSFNGRSQISVPVHFSIATGQTKNCSISVTVFENGCPSVSSNKSGIIRSYSLQ